MSQNIISYLDVVYLDFTFFSLDIFFIINLRFLISHSLHDGCDECDVYGTWMYLNIYPTYLGT